MNQLFLASLIAGPALISACSMQGNRKPVSGSCACDSIKTQKIISDKEFNRIPIYDTSSFSETDFYKLDSAVNKTLWYRDVENPDTTRFTHLWNDYFPANYHASHKDFVNFYEGRKDIELAFQFGPNMDLWAYHIFIIKKIECCYLVTRSYFRHARFTYKAYSIINSHQLDTLFSIIGKIHTDNITNDTLGFKYSGHFMDNRNGKKFFIDFEKETEKDDAQQKPKQEVKQLYDFIDNIRWIETYS